MSGVQRTCNEFERSKLAIDSETSVNSSLYSQNMLLREITSHGFDKLRNSNFTHTYYSLLTTLPSQNLLEIQTE